jgi:nucleoside-diphosphate kinase
MYIFVDKKTTMRSDITFTMIKPDAVAEGNAGAILKMIEAADFKILAMKLTHLSLEQAAKFYEVHKGKPFYEDLCEYMSSGKIVAMVLSKRDAVKEYRQLIGATDPSKAETGTIRKLYAKSIQSNAVHGSDSDENAQIEANFFFSGLEYFE